MKIHKIHFTSHDVFTNHDVVIGNPDVPDIAFLVGNNGSGKTKILDAIYLAFTTPFDTPSDYDMSFEIEFSPDEIIQYQIPQTLYRYSVKKDRSTGNVRELKQIDGTQADLVILDNAKCVFSTIEVNFNESQVNSVTSKNIDDQLIPKEKSQNLATEIPQLLVDIKNLDDADIADWHNQHKPTGHPDPFPDVGTRLQRFTDAFHRIYDGEKTFSQIKNVGGSKKIIFLDRQGAEISLNELSTGEKQVIYRVGYILKNLGNIRGGIVLIDEPEISLHPSWQIKLKDFLLEVFAGFDVQIIVATHSPYIFQGLDETREVCIGINRANNESKKINMVFPGVPYTPTVQLISYLAYGLVSEILHIELYTLLQIREGRDRIHDSIREIEDWLRDSAGGNMPVYKTFTRTGQNTPTEESMMTWIRNRIHHPDETARPNFSQAELKTSIDQMIRILS